MQNGALNPGTRPVCLDTCSEGEKQSVQPPQQSAKTSMMCCKLPVAGMPLLLYTGADLPRRAAKKNKKPTEVIHKGKHSCPASSINTFAT